MHHKINFILLLLFSIPSFAYQPNQGDAAPEFEITSIKGESFKLSDFKGKQSVYVVYWNTWCHYCMKKIPKLKAVEQKFSDQIKIIALNTSRDDSVQESLDFQKRFEINYMLAFDNNEVITDLYNVHGVPTEFIIDINGIIQFRDDVPEDIEAYLSKWNTVSIQNNSNYFTRLVAIVFPQVPNISDWNTHFSHLINANGGLKRPPKG